MRVGWGYDNWSHWSIQVPSSYARRAQRASTWDVDPHVVIDSTGGRFHTCRPPVRTQHQVLLRLQVFKCTLIQKVCILLDLGEGRTLVACASASLVLLDWTLVACAFASPVLADFQAQERSSFSCRRYTRAGQATGSLFKFRICDVINFGSPIVTSSNFDLQVQP